jgi:hypothetical protein
MSRLTASRFQADSWSRGGSEASCPGDPAPHERPRAKNDRPKWSFVIRHKEGRAITTPSGMLCWYQEADTREEAEREVIKRAAKRSGLPAAELTLMGQPENYAATEAEGARKDPHP